MTTSSTMIALISFGIGVGAFIATQTVTKDLFTPIMEVCMPYDTNQPNAMEEFVSTTSYHRFDERVGLKFFTPLVCLITQFMVDLTTYSPMGVITWGTTMICAIPATILINIESTRSTNGGFVKWPVTIGILAQLFGISVIFPLLWVPSYCLFCSGKQQSSAAAANTTLAKMSPLLCLPFVILTICVFTLPTDSDLWTTCAGIMGGPVVCLLNVVTWIFPGPSNTTKQEFTKSVQASINAYAIGGAFALIGWIYMLYVMYETYEFDYMLLYKTIWSEAHPSVQFMTIDAAVLWMGLILHILSRNVKSGLEAIMFTPIFGPGAACSLVLSTLEAERRFDGETASSTATESSQEKKKDR